MTSCDKIKNILDRVKSTKVSGDVKRIADTHKDVKIYTDGFNKSTYAGVLAALGELKYVIVALANHSWSPYVNEIDWIEISKTLVKDVARTNLITWMDICECLYSYFIANDRCVVSVVANREKISRFAIPNIRVDIKFDITRGKIVIVNMGRNVVNMKLPARFEIDSAIFYDEDIVDSIIDNDTNDNVVSNKTQSQDDEMELFFQSRNSRNNGDSINGDSM